MKMTLKKWDALSKKQKHQLIRQWHKNDECDEYESLVMKAALALKEQLRIIPQVTNVDLGAGEIISYDRETAFPLREQTLIVLTMFPSGVELKQIPKEFSGFSVSQDNLADKRDAYLQTWKRLFKELKGWNEPTILEWTAKWDDSLTGRQLSAIYHYGPIKVAQSSLVDPNIETIVADRIQYLYSDIREAIGCEHPDLVENYDWERTRKEIARIIEKYVKVQK